MRNLLIIFVSLLFFACNSSDVVNDHEPVNIDDWRTKLVSRLQSAGTDAERSMIMEESGVRLTSQLIHFLKSNGYNCWIDTIEYRYGNGKAMNVASGDGNTYNGKFTSQPYAIVKGGECFQDSLFVLILCFNGTFELTSKDSRIIGGGAQVFSIAPGKGINHYVDYKTAIWLAENFNLALYKGRGWNENNRITPWEAINLETQLDKVQVTVRVYAGDTFDLRNMTLNGQTAN